MKKYFFIITTIFLIVFAFSGISASAEIYGDLEYYISNEQVVIRGCDDSATNIEIPNYISGYPVTTVSLSPAFYCNNLVSITIPENVTTIDISFRSCTNLEEINVSENNQYYASIDGVLFNKSKTILISCPTASKMRTYTIPNSVTVIGENAFYGCKNLINVTIPDSVVEIGECAFYNCPILTDIIIPDSVDKIGSLAFAGCFSLTKVNITDRITEIGNGAFTSCLKL